MEFSFCRDERSMTLNPLDNADVVEQVFGLRNEGDSIILVRRNILGAPNRNGVRDVIGFVLRGFGPDSTLMTEIKEPAPPVTVELDTSEVADIEEVSDNE